MASAPNQCRRPSRPLRRQPPHRAAPGCAGFAGGEGVEGQAGRDGDLLEMGMEVTPMRVRRGRPLVRAVGLEPTRRCHRGF